MVAVGVDLLDNEVVFTLDYISLTVIYSVVPNYEAVRSARLRYDTPLNRSVGIGKRLFFLCNTVCDIFLIYLEFKALIPGGSRRNVTKIREYYLGFDSLSFHAYRPNGLTFL